MTDQPRPRRASYTLHIISTANFAASDQIGPFPRLDLALMMDRVLDLFDTEARFNAFTLDGQVAPIEDYLTIRPENFERVEQAVQHGKLLLGPWYARPDFRQDSAETIIRNLLIGLSTAAAFGRPLRVGYLSRNTGLPAYLPQILRSFGIDSAILPRPSDDAPTEVIWQGDDGTIIVTGYAAPLGDSISAQRQALAPYNRAGHLLLVSAQTQDIPALLKSLPAAQVELHDSVFHSSPEAYAKALITYARGHEPFPTIHGEVHTMADTAMDSDGRMIPDGGKRLLTDVIEPFSVWSEHDGTPDWFLPRPQRLIQSMWRDTLKRGVTDDIRQLAAKIQGVDFPPIAESSHPAFIVLATKLPENPDRSGMIVRGVNTTGDDVWVTLTPWRPFAVVETVTMDEAATGGKLAPAENGATRFKAGSHRIITLWFHD